MFQAFQQRRWPLIILWVVIVAAMVAAPAVLPVFRLNLLGRFLSLAIVALGIDLIWGFTGLLSLLGDIKTVASGHPLQPFGVHGFPADRLGFYKQGTGNRTHQERKHHNSQHSTHVLPQPSRATCSAST